MIRKKKGVVELDEKRDGESFRLKNVGKCGSWVELVRLSSFECGMVLVKWEIGIVVWKNFFWGLGVRVRVRVIRAAIAGKFLTVDNNITLFKGA